MRIVIPVYDRVDLLDVTGPHEMFGWARVHGAPFEILVAAETAGCVVTRDGFRFEAPHSFAEVGRADVLWVPGGDPASLKAIMGEAPSRFLRFIREQAETARLVASVCEGALLLAAAGLLDGYKATTHWAFVPCLLKSYPKVTVVDGFPRFHVDRNRITGGGISSGLDEALKVIEMLAGRDIAERVQQTTQYYPAPPVASEIPATIDCPLDDPT